MYFNSTYNDYYEWYDLFVGRIDGTDYLIDYNGEIISDGYRSMDRFMQNDLIYVWLDEPNTYGYINSKGERLPHKYSTANNFRYDVANVVIDGEDCLINENFEVVFQAGDKQICTYDKNTVMLKDDLSHDEFILVDYNNNVLFDYNNYDTRNFEYIPNWGVKIMYSNTNEFFDYNGPGFFDIIDFDIASNYMFVLDKNYVLSVYDKEYKLITQKEISHECRYINAYYDEYSGEIGITCNLKSDTVVNKSHFYMFDNRKLTKKDECDNKSYFFLENKNYYMIREYDYSYTIWINFPHSIIYDLEGNVIYDIEWYNSCPLLTSDGYMLRNGYIVKIGTKKGIGKYSDVKISQSYVDA